jgi:hypothetical protein
MSDNDTADRPAESDCDARVTYGKRWECVPCCFAWLIGDARPRCSKLTFARLIETAMDESIRLESSQSALVAAGLRSYPDQDQLRRAMELRKLADLAAKYRDQRESRHET